METGREKGPVAPVESWEIDLAAGIARSFKSYERFEDLEAELFAELAELKQRGLSEIRDWKSFLAQSLFNAAKDFIEKNRTFDRKALSLDIEPRDDGSRKEPWIERFRTRGTEDMDFSIQWRTAWGKLSPELQNLWQILMEEDGNIVNTAKRLGRPRKTVEYWVKNKLGGLFKKSGLL